MRAYTALDIGARLLTVIVSWRQATQRHQGHAGHLSCLVPYTLLTYQNNPSNDTCRIQKLNSWTQFFRNNWGFELCLRCFPHRRDAVWAPRRVRCLGQFSTRIDEGSKNCCLKGVKSWFHLKPSSHVRSFWCTKKHLRLTSWSAECSKSKVQTDMISALSKLPPDGPWHRLPHFEWMNAGMFLCARCQPVFSDPKVHGFSAACCWVAFETKCGRALSTPHGGSDVCSARKALLGASTQNYKPWLG